MNPREPHIKNVFENILDSINIVFFSINVLFCATSKYFNYLPSTFLTAILFQYVYIINDLIYSLFKSNVPHSIFVHDVIHFICCISIIILFAYDWILFDTINMPMTILDKLVIGELYSYLIFFIIVIIFRYY